MKTTLFAILFALILAGPSASGNSGEELSAPNSLRTNPAVSVYRADDKNVVEYVEGVLSEPTARGDEIKASLRFFDENKGAFGMQGPADELKLKRVDNDRLGMRHVRFEQNYRGLKVINRELIAHFTAAGVLKTVNGSFEPDIELNITPRILPAEATSEAVSDLADFFGQCSPGEPELVVFPWEGTHFLVWRLFLYSDTPMGRWEYFIDAGTGEVIYKANRIMNANDVGIGVGVMDDTLFHIDTHFDGGSYIMMDYTRQYNNDPHGHGGMMPDGNYLRTNVAGSTLPGSVASDDDNYWKDSTQASSVSGHVYTATVYDWMLRQFYRNSFDDNGASMLTIVDYSGEGDNNAYWDGSRIVVWSWSSGWRSLAGCPDVIAHEWGHAVTEYTSGLVYQKEPGALNESFSDMMGAAFEWANDTLDDPDWKMGENGQIDGDGFRSMSDPHLYEDPDYYGPSDPYWVDVENCTPSWYNDYCGVHTNSGVGNKWFYLLSDGGLHHGVTVTGIGVADAMKIAYQANAYYWTSNTDYHSAALATISAAYDLDSTGAWAGQVANAWNAVGVSTPGPSLVFTYPLGTPAVLVPDEATTFEVVVNGLLGGVPVPGSEQLHYSVNDGLYSSELMSEISAGHYEATLPAFGCDSQVRFYVSAQESGGGMFYDPDTTAPNMAIVATDVVVVFEDNFETDKGWSVSGDASTGQWDRGVPVGGGDRGDPPTDFDGSGKCYLTENVYGDSDIDGGTTVLTSPTFDLSSGDALVHYARWYSNNFGSAPFSDEMEVYISNNDGSDWTLVETVGPVEQSSGGWYEHEFWVSDFVVPSAQVRLRFDASDLGDGSVVEAAVDDVTVTSYLCTQNTPVILTESLADWTVGVPYSQQLEAEGGTGALTWSDKYNDLIGTGLTLSPGGLLSGSPFSDGLISFTAMVTDEAASTDEKLFSFTINPHVQITTSGLPDWTEGRAYTQTLEAAGGTAPLSWSDKYSDLVGTGLTVASNGELSGIPVSAGVISFTANVDDGVGDADEKLFSFTINPAVSVTTDSLPFGREGKSYSYLLESSGGTGEKTWSDKYGDLDGTGLTVSPEGLLSGVPLLAGTLNFTAGVEDIAGSNDDKQLSVEIGPAFVCGDANRDEKVNLLDITFLINYLYKDGSAPYPVESGDVNNSGSINMLDVTYLINYIYKSGAVPDCSEK